MRFRCLGRFDTAALDGMYADDYTLANESGVLITKAPRLAVIKSGELKYEAVSFEDVNIRLHGNTVVATYPGVIKAL